VVLVAWASPPLSLLWSQRMRTSQSGAATVAAATSAAAAAPPLPPVSPSEHTSIKIHGTCTPPRNTMPHADAHHAHALVPTQAMIHRHRFLRTQPMSAKRVPWAPTHQSESMPKLPAKFVVVRCVHAWICMPHATSVRRHEMPCPTSSPPCLAIRTRRHPAAPFLGLRRRHAQLPPPPAPPLTKPVPPIFPERRATARWNASVSAGSVGPRFACQWPSTLAGRCGMPP